LAPDEQKPHENTWTIDSGKHALGIRGLGAGYDKWDVLHDVSLDVAPGEVVCVLGHNGAGKTTLLRTVLGILEARSGTVEFFGEEVTGRSYVERVRAGMSLTPAEAPVFRELRVLDNLDLGAFTVADDDQRRQNVEQVLKRFPLLAQRAKQRAGTMSGGEQRILSIGMALAAAPKLMLLDEPSLGIAPVLIKSIFADIRSIVDRDGLAVLLVEQNVRAALGIADRVYYMRQGTVIMEENAKDASARESWWELF